MSQAWRAANEAGSSPESAGVIEDRAGGVVRRVALPVVAERPRPAEARVRARVERGGRRPQAPERRGQERIVERAQPPDEQRAAGAHAASLTRS